MSTTRQILFFALAIAKVATVAMAQTPLGSQPVSAALERSAFADTMARTLLLRARAARLVQDSLLQGYDAKTVQRMSISMGVRAVGPTKLLFRAEQAARVRWSRASGILIEPTGQRASFPMGASSIDLTETTPIPFFPGRESLWLPIDGMGVVKKDVNETDLRHPLAAGAEAYYRYATGDALTIVLTDGDTIRIRELRITARHPEWRAFVGSFWFDVKSGSLVRAVYRLAADLDFWQMGWKDSQRQNDSLRKLLRTDTSAAARETKQMLDNDSYSLGDKVGIKLMEGTLRPIKGTISAITVEYGLYEGRFWLPRLNVAEGELDATLLRLPVKWEESFHYDGVYGANAPAAIPQLAATAMPVDTSLHFGGSDVELSIGGARDTSWSALPFDRSKPATLAHEDSAIARLNHSADSLGALATRATANGDTTKAQLLHEAAESLSGTARLRLIRLRACGTGQDSSYFAGVISRYDGALSTAVWMPCDMSHLDHSSDLSGSIDAADDPLFDSVARDALLSSLDLSLQPGWAPQPPVFLTGLSFLRYNRVEGLSLGGSASSVLGLGYTMDATARYGFADRIPNGELSVTRSNGRSQVRVSGYSQLTVANDDWGTPLSFGASVANLLYARDEGFYYRAAGASLAGGLASAPFRWRLFAERQRSAGVAPRTQASFGNLFADPRFGDNIDAVPLTALGGEGTVRRSFGENPTGMHLDTRLRVEGALTDRVDSTGTSGYGRFMADATFTRAFQPFAIALTGAAGTSAGTLPIQRGFFVGGLQTVRGQFARASGDGRVGDAFWLGRAEVGKGVPAARLTVFSDVGWAGARTNIMRPGRPLSGAGVGLTLLDGLLRLEVSRGIWPEQRWRTDFYFGARL